ncbi:MAG: ubiquinol-cytochrome C chaperone family protein [Rhodospirillales bacterium]|nr:ubiquinol-cytochrome C chaperone family protein [Rhodospirillales bacterium]
MKLLKKIFSFSHEKETAHKLYRSIVEQARDESFYRDFGVADTFDGRFDMITLHMVLVMRRLKNDVDQTRKLSQALFDFMFDDFDLNLRELGIGDMGVLSRVKKMAKAFYGRLEAYDNGLKQQDNTNLCEALQRNLYRENDATPENLAAIAAYMRQESERLNDLDIALFMNGQLEFGPAPQVSKE